MKSYTEFVEQLSGYAKLRYGSTPATATKSSISGAVDRALSNLGSSQSASQTTGRTGLSGSGSISYSGTINKKPAPTKPQPTQSSTSSTPSRPTSSSSKPKPSRPTSSSSRPSRPSRPSGARDLGGGMSISR